MRFVIQALVIASLLAMPCGAAVAPKGNSVAGTTSPIPETSDAPTWAPDSSPDNADPGFAPLSVTQSGVVYSPVAPAFNPAAREQAKIADLPAWASSYFAVGDDPHPGWLSALSARGSLPEPAAWALLLVGVAMICGALRGLIMANRRLARLRSEDAPPD